MRAVAQAGTTLGVSLAGSAEASGDLTLELQAGDAIELPELPLLQALAGAAGGGLDAVSGTHWRLRLPYGPTSAMPAQPA